MFEKIITIFKNPLSAMSAAALLIAASTRIAYAIVVFGALLWVFFICSVIFYFADGALPKKKSTGVLPGARTIIEIMMSGFWGSVYYLILYLLNPFLAMENILWIMLTPVFYCAYKAGCESKYITSDANSTKKENSVKNMIKQAVCLGILIFIIALIREPLGFGSLSIPGGNGGIIELFSIQNISIPIQIISCSAGAFFLSAYILIVLRYLTKGSKNGDEQ
jgi:hypothetical protein